MFVIKVKAKYSFYMGGVKDEPQYRCIMGLRMHSVSLSFCYRSQFHLILCSSLVGNLLLLLVAHTNKPEPNTGVWHLVGAVNRYIEKMKA